MICAASAPRITPNRRVIIASMRAPIRRISGAAAKSASITDAAERLAQAVLQQASQNKGKPS